MTTYSPLRYPGGKGKLAKQFAKICKDNNINFYIEPYSGGCGVGLYLLLNNCVNRIVINDIDPLIYSFWFSILNYKTEFIDKLRNIPLNIDTWYEQKNIVKNYSKYDIFTIGFATFYMNRANRSGIIKAGVIGGKKQDGKYKIDARFNKESLITKIENIAKHREQISLYNLDAKALIEKLYDEIDLQTLIYFDPPYFFNANTLYKNFYKVSDHHEVGNFIQTIKTPWVVTYDNVEPIRQIYYSSKKLSFQLAYTVANKREKGEELLIYNNLQLL